MIHESVVEIDKTLTGNVTVGATDVTVLNEEVVRGQLINTLVRDAIFGTPQVRSYAKWLIWELGQQLDARPASIHDYYIARARNEFSAATVPAMNLRMMSYEMICAAIRAAKRTDASAIIFELARSEMVFSQQDPDDYSALVIAGAISNGYTNPLFIQGDHFQVNHTLYKTDPEKAIQEVKDLVTEAVPAGFWNIDIDTSTLVDLEPADVNEQQRLNYEHSAELTAFIRGVEPEGVTISLGGEIGEVGLANSTVEELDAYMENYQRRLAEHGDFVGLSKVSVATGTSHGGVILPDGSLADVAVDFDLLNQLGDRAREHGAGGAVQHGASTLPRSFFQKFPESQTIEIHLAAGFQNLVLDHPRFPAELLADIYVHLDAHHAAEREAGDTDSQFYKKARKHAAGSFKAELYQLPADVHQAIMTDLEEFFTFLFEKLGAANTREQVDKFVQVVEYHQPKPVFTRIATEDTGLAD